MKDDKSKTAPWMVNYIQWDTPTSVDDLKEMLCDLGYEDAIVFDPDFASAAIGVSEDGRVIYDYELMAEELVSEGMTYEEAVEYIDYNPVRSLPYLGQRAPIIMTRLQRP